MKKAVKKIIAGFLFTVLFLSAVIIPQVIGTTFSAKQSLFAEEQKLIAHRGLSSVMPENTIPAFEEAGKAGFYGAECDIHTTVDGVIIVMHDDDVDRVTNGEGDIENMTFEEINALNIDAGNGIENCENLKVPTFEEYLSVCAKYGMCPYIELKKLDTAYLPDMFALIDKYGFSETAVLISFEMDYLIEARKLDENMKMMYLSNNPSREKIDICIENGFGLDLNFISLIKYIPEFKYAKEQGLTTAMWIVDYPVISDFLHLIGVDYITSNRIVP